MNKQQVIERLNNKLSETLKFQKIFEPLSEGHSGCESRANAYMTAINYVEQLDEPQKVKVPAYVAEWIELCKEKADLSSCLNGYYEIGDGTIVRPRGFSEEFYDWLSDYDHMHDLARAYLDGYEVEEESKYRIEFPISYGYRYLSKNKSGQTVFTSAVGDYTSKFTEQEIKSIDERYWPFAVPVEKV